ncbi:hypothetical protein Tco_0666664 [Tanacetum coccineum]
MVRLVLRIGNWYAFEKVAAWISIAPFTCAINHFAHFDKVMDALVISISSDTSEESVGSHPSRVILFGAIPAIIPVIPEVLVVPADPIVTPEDSLPPTPDLPLVSPFLCSDDSEENDESEPAEKRPVSSSHDTLAPLSEFPLTPVVAPPRIRRRSATLVRPGEANPFGRPYCTHLNGPRKLLIARKRRFVHRSLARTPRHSEAFRRWRVTPLSTPYPSTTSESSLGSSFKRSLDSSSPSSRPSRKRCRSPTASVPSSTHVSRSIAPTSADLLPPRKRFRDSYSPEVSGEEHMEVDTANAEAVVDVGISEGVVAHPEDGVGIGFEIDASNVREDDEEFEAEAINGIGVLRNPLVWKLKSEIAVTVGKDDSVRIDRITEIETTQRQLETSQMVASGERASLVERIGSLRLEYLKVRAMLSIYRDRINSVRWHIAL